MPIHRRIAFADQSSKQTDDLITAASITTREIAKVTASLEAEPANTALRTRYEELHQELDGIHQALQEESHQILASMKAEYGLTDEVLQAIEDADRPALKSDYWASDIQKVPTTCKLEDAVSSGYEQLLPRTDQDWLRGQAKHRYRQSYHDGDNSDCRLHLVGRQRLLPTTADSRPQRFAQMLLVCEDLLSGRHDIDMFDGPMLVSEAAALGTLLPEISQLGPEAERKLASLPFESQRDVASTVFELLVGASCIRSGLSTEMLPASNEQKTPDFRVHDLVVPMVVECKRRLGLNQYGENEARHVERLYDAAQEHIDKYHPLVEVIFADEVSRVQSEEFVNVIASLCDSWDDDVESVLPWGTVRLCRLPNIKELTTTRVFSPVFLQEVFDWNNVESNWDGLLCQIAPTTPLVSKVSWPRGMKWRCDADKSVLKKARGLTSLWAQAVHQIPAGEMGSVYIAYTEGMRPAIADARNQHLLDTVRNKELFHRASVRVPLTVIDRLYPQALGNGGLELIESIIPMTLDGYEFMLEDWPLQVFHVNQSGLTG